MLRLPTFRHEAPETVDGVLALLAEHPGRARLLAGGTDLLPNMKHGIEEADVVVSLARLPALDAVEEREDGGLRLGAMLTLEHLAAHPTVRARYPSSAARSPLPTSMRGGSTISRPAAPR